jgi:hypothetical protein
MAGDCCAAGFRAGLPPLWVIFDRDEASNRFPYVGCAPESGSKIQGTGIYLDGP